jgi:hypothetical protein
MALGLVVHRMATNTQGCGCMAKSMAKGQLKKTTALSMSGLGHVTFTMAQGSWLSKRTILLTYLAAEMMA